MIFDVALLAAVSMLLLVFVVVIGTSLFGPLRAMAEEADIPFDFIIDRHRLALLFVALWLSGLASGVVVGIAKMVQERGVQ